AWHRHKTYRYPASASRLERGAREMWEEATHVGFNRTTQNDVYRRCCSRIARADRTSLTDVRVSSRLFRQCDEEYRYPLRPRGLEYFLEITVGAVDHSCVVAIG